MRRHGLLLSTLGIAAAVAAAPRPARAQSGSDKAAAEALFDEGKRLFLAKKFAEACPRFESSQRLDPGIGTLLFLADCYENVGKVASAWATFREAASEAEAAGEAERDHVATERARRLEPRLYRLTIKVDPTPGLQLSRNETEVKPAAWNASLPVDPGTYTIKATAPGKKPWSIRLIIPASPGAQEVDVPRLDDDAVTMGDPRRVPQTPPGTMGGPQTPPGTMGGPPPPAPEDPGHGQRVAGLVVGGIGVIGVAVAGALAPVAASKFSTAKTTCASAPCSDKTGVDLAHDAVVLANGATAAVVVGGAALAAGVITFLTAPRAKRSAPKTGRAWVAPLLAPGTAGLAGGLVFQ